MNIFTIYQTFFSFAIGLAVMFFVGGESLIQTVQGFQAASEVLTNGLK